MGRLRCKAARYGVAASAARLTTGRQLGRLDASVIDCLAAIPGDRKRDDLTVLAYVGVQEMAGVYRIHLYPDQAHGLAAFFARRFPRREADKVRHNRLIREQPKGTAHVFNIKTPHFNGDRLNDPSCEEPEHKSQRRVR